MTISIYQMECFAKLPFLHEGGRNKDHTQFIRVISGRALFQYKNQMGEP